MSFNILLLTMCFLYFEQQLIFAVTVHKLVYPKDLSEHCRRRVVPSVFLGRRTLEANAQIMQFTSLELPYSCFISVKTESGSNIVLVVQLLSESTALKSCSKNGNQLSIYEMGETFGGYWGPIPDPFITPRGLDYTKYYTRRKTTTKIVTTKKPSTVQKSEPEELITTHSQPKIKQYEKNDDENYIRILMPLVNVSGKLLPNEMFSEKKFDVDDVFDYFYDVTPKVGSQHVSSIMPLLQFSLQVTKDANRRDEGDKKANYQLDYNIDMLTPDARLLPSYLWSATTKMKKPFPKYNSYVNRRFRLKKNNTKLFKIRSQSRHPALLSHTRKRINKGNDFILQTRSTKQPNSDVISSTKSQNVMKTILRRYNVTLEGHTTKYKHMYYNKNISMLLKNNSDLPLNIAAYSTFNSSIQNKYNVFPIKKHDCSSYRKHNKITTAVVNESNSTLIQLESRTQYNATTPVHKYIVTNSTTEVKWNSENRTRATEKITNESMLKEKQFIDIVNFTTNSIQSTEKQRTEDSKVVYNSYYRAGTDDQVTLSETHKNINEYKIKNELNNHLKMVTESMTMNISNSDIAPIHIVDDTKIMGTLVDRESWENVVQVAPVIATVLNQNTTGINSTKSVLKNSQTRIKRHIQAIPIENARPHSIHTTNDFSTIADFVYKASEMQEFAQLVELQDDEIHSRVALRYLRRYAGPVMFNICDNQETKVRQTLLFNTSRIILAVTNFTMERMLVVATAVRTLASAEMKCAINNIECQISGTRVCVDSTSACDGIPNCGSYDIYDEDRFLCGGVSGLQHNVYLAAIIFLALLLTMLYTIHYWLKRCVPNVSEAFFVYNDGTENVLYLNSIMKSPMDDNDDSKIVYHGNMFDDDMATYIKDEKKNKNMFYKMIAKCIGLFSFCKKHSDKRKNMEIMEDLNKSPSRTYSFAELEIRKMLQRQCTDIAIQTGDSLELLLQIKKKPESDLVKEKRYESKKTNKDETLNLQNKTVIPEQHEKELNVLKFVRESRSGSNQTLSSNVVSKQIGSGYYTASCDESELQSTVYDHIKDAEKTEGPVVTTCEVHVEPQSSKQIKKRLRFDEVTTTIPTSDVEENYDMNTDKTNDRKRSLGLGIGRSWRDTDTDFDTIIHDPDHSTSTARDFMRFWTSSKNKKSKKKTQQSSTLR